MPSTVETVFAAADLERDGLVLWGERLPSTAPGVYIVALTDDSHSPVPGPTEAPLSRSTIETLLNRRPELTLDGRRPTADELAARVAAFWLPDEVVLYIGLAGSSLQDRVGQYYSTKLGARSPHAGGWFIKTLAVLDDLYVHYASCRDPAGAEGRMLDVFSAAVSASTRAELHDSDRPIPFANLEWPKCRYKKHGIAGAKEPRRRELRLAPEAGVARPRSSAPLGRNAEKAAHRTQRVTAPDLSRGQIRIPRGATKSVFPREAGDVDVELREERFTCPWNPRYGPDRERSGVLRVGKQRLGRLVSIEEILFVSSSDGVIRLS